MISLIIYELTIFFNKKNYSIDKFKEKLNVR